ncbi:unnamed protein product, partial [marine sediment metagenome]
GQDFILKLIYNKFISKNNVNFGVKILVLFKNIDIDETKKN